MEKLGEIISNYNTEIIIGLIVSLFIVLILYLIEQFRFSRITEKYNALVKGVENGNLEEILMNNLKEIDDLRLEVNRLQLENKELDERVKNAIQKIGFIRYNAFSDMGSELSFSIALLDDKLNGFVITSIYGREESTAYAKPILDGQSKYQLSVEEMQAIDRAIKNEKYVRTV